MISRKEFINLFGEDPVDILGQDWKAEVEDYLLERNLCPDCLSELPEPEREDRGGAYPFENYELVTYCKCGKTFIN